MGMEYVQLSTLKLDRERDRDTNEGVSGTDSPWMKITRDRDLRHGTHVCEVNDVLIGSAIASEIAQQLQIVTLIARRSTSYRVCVDANLHDMAELVVHCLPNQAICVPAKTGEGSHLADNTEPVSTESVSRAQRSQLN